MTKTIVIGEIPPLPKKLKPIVFERGLLSGIVIGDGITST